MVNDGFHARHVVDGDTVIATFAGSAESDSYVRARMAIATHELFENAIKFSDDGLTVLEIEMRRAPRFGVKILTHNRAKSTDLTTLHQLDASLRETTDAMTLYLDLMRSAPRARGGLGIGRVAAEAEMKVRMSFAGHEVMISAELEDAA